MSQTEAANSEAGDAGLTIAPEIRRAHQDLGEISGALLRHIESHPKWWQRDSFTELDRQTWNPYPMQSWPVIIGPEKTAELTEASLGLVQLLRVIPSRIFRHGIERASAFYRLGNPDLTRMIFEELPERDGISSRADFIDTADGLKVLEVNLGSPGGLQLAKMAQLYLDMAPVREFLDSRPEQVSFTDSVRVLFQHVAAEAVSSLSLKDRTLNVALLTNEEFAIQTTRSYGTYLNRVLTSVLEELAPQIRGQVVLGIHRSLRERQGHPWLGNTRLDAVVELGNSNWRTSFRAWKTGEVHLYNGPLSMILADKRNLAFLSENQERPLLQPEEQDIVRRFIPWTRQVTPGYTDYQGERIRLPTFIAEHRERLVLKPGRSGQGKDVYLGATTSAETWGQVLTQALASSEWVVQEYIESRPYLCQLGEHGACPHDLIWGIFTFGPYYGGGFLRMQAKGEKRIVNAAQGATEGVFLEASL